MSTIYYRKYDEAAKRYIEEDVDCTMRVYNWMNKAIVKVIFNDPATIVFWGDGSKTVVKAVDESFNPEKGLAMAVAKKFFGNEGNYYNVFKKWLPKEKTNDQD